MRNFSSEKRLKAPDEIVGVNHIGITWEALPVSPESRNGAAYDHIGEAALWVGGKSGRPQALGGKNPGSAVVRSCGPSAQSLPFPALQMPDQERVDFYGL